MLMTKLSGYREYPAEWFCNPRVSNVQPKDPEILHTDTNGVLRTILSSILELRTRSSQQCWSLLCTRRRTVNQLLRVTLRRRGTGRQRSRLRWGAWSIEIKTYWTEHKVEDQSLLILYSLESMYESML